jgi:glutathione synthase/RimK-type ligase-like ATP-grasp enzyme
MQSDKLKIAILRDNKPNTSLGWEQASSKFGVDYIVVDMLRSDWLRLIRKYDPSFCVCRPPGDIFQSKRAFDEKVFFLERNTKYRLFPGFNEIFFYENKASLSYFLDINGISHPKTFVSYSKSEAIEFIDKVKYPIVGKTIIGATGSGIKILNSFSIAEKYVSKAFSKGIKRRYGPNPKTGTPAKWLKKAIQSPSYLLEKLKEYKEKNEDSQKNVVLFQQYIPHEYEWRCAKIGDSYFAYKKLKIGDKASGSKVFEYGAPPFALLDFTKKLCEKFNFIYMTVDVFIHNSTIYVNELQTIFGHKNPYICKVDGKTGRYLYKNGNWIFEEGDFNSNESYDLRLKTAIDSYNGQL